MLPLTARASLLDSWLGGVLTATQGSCQVIGVPSEMPGTRYARLVRPPQRTLRWGGAIPDLESGR